MNSEILAEAGAEVVLDSAQIFQLFCVFCGDCVKTAAAAGVRPVDVLRVATSEGWTEKLGPILELSKSQKAGDWERACNRAVNYVQAHKLRMFLERVLSRVTGMNAEELQEYVFTSKVDKNGVETAKVLSTRALADLASAVEKCHAMSYLALNDTAQDRGRRKEQATDSEADCSTLHLKIAAAMSQVKAASASSPRLALLEAQVQLAASVVNEASKMAPPDNPYDKEH